MQNRFAAAVPQLPVRHVEASQRYYRDVLGFRLDGIWSEGAYGSVTRDNTVIHLYRENGEIAANRVVISVRDVDAVFEEWSASGATIVSDLEEKPWGTREFAASDLDGHRLRVCQASRVSPHLSREVIESVRIVRRLPTTAEYHGLVEAVKWTEFASFEDAASSLARSLFSVVAELDGRCIGMARVVGDGALLFCVMDVAVLPEFQGRGVGTSLMNEIVGYMSATGKGKALVGLFTGGAGASFFERFGFNGPEADLLGMSARSLSRA